MSRRGFTLLELMLALGLTVIVVAAITTATYQYMLQLTRQQREIERKQIARGVVQMVGDDLRAAIQSKPQDYSGLENLIESQSLSGIGGLLTGVDGDNIDPGDLEQGILDAVAGGGGGQGEGAGMSAGDPAASDDGSGDGDEEMTEEEEEIELPGRPTLIGSERFVRIDTSRMPRMDEYNPLVARRGSDSSLPSDIKTVTWFYSDAAPQDGDPLSRDFGKNGGLYRRQIDRAVEAWRGEEYVDPRPDMFCDLVSPEISSVKFRYWNGDEWRTSWDSAEEDGFPYAIEVQITLDPKRSDAGSNNRSKSDSSGFDAKEKYRTVVHLPIADPAVPEEEEVEQ